MATTPLPLSINDLYDENFYRARYSDLSNLSSRELYQHLLTVGLTEGRNFSPYFDFDFYKLSNPSLANLSNRQLVDDFLNRGIDAGLKFSPYFDLDVYRASNPDLAQLSNRELLVHFRDSGVNEGRKSTLIFDPEFYRYANPDLSQLNNKQAFYHVQTTGIQQGLEFSPFFDITFFRTANPDLANSLNNRQLLEQFFINGLPQSRRFSPFVDITYYKSNNSDLANLSNTQLLTNLENVGIFQGRPFSSLVDLNFYRTSNPDLAALNNKQLLEHLETFGLNEGRRFSSVVDLNSYRNTNSTFQTLSNRDLFENFQLSGLSNGVALSNLLDLKFYKKANPDLETLTDAQLIEHFQNAGLREGRKFSPYFDASFYVNNNPDLLAAGFKPYESRTIEHFLRFGLAENRPFSQFFNLDYYRNNNFDLRNLTPAQAFRHFIDYGIKEGRRPSVLFDSRYYIANNPDLLAKNLTFEEAFQDFQISGFTAPPRPASIFFDPNTIAPLVTGSLANPNNISKWRDIPLGGTLTYSFVTTASAFLYEGSESGVAEVSPQIKDNVRNIMRQFAETINLNLVEVPDRPPNVGRIRILFSDLPGSQNLSGTSLGPTDSPGNGRNGDIHLNPQVANEFEQGPGSFGYESLLFLVGGALGLTDYGSKRGQTGESTSPDLPLAKDNNTNTVMTLNFIPGEYDGSYASTPMPYDIRTLQYLYGTSTFNSGDTVYNFGNNNLLVKRTIWDAGGIDTLDFSGWGALPENVRVNGLDYYFDMNEGGQNTTQIALPRQSPPSAVATGATYTYTPSGSSGNNGTTSTFRTTSYATRIAFGTEIENLVGSQGNDEILGNNLGNNIIGGPGNDKIAGAKGPDIIYGGAGADTFVFAPGDGGANPSLADFIGDFKKEEGDKIGLALALPFSALTISQGTGANANNTLIRITATGEYLAVLAGVSASSLNASDFISADVQSFIP
ncbi:M10 family metallopeptidase [Aerosakkonemataceae cyanobacterium BLCC-F50]|uniref:M10 family metallopeptidase n=1 Tax=Floridaenema flaviceps BLCC-F50 TaxID=3153642 RepID=A0ABV4XWK7_9CYAN